MRPMFLILSIFLILSFLSSLFGEKVAGQKENPAVAKIRLCDTATFFHDNFLIKYLEKGILKSHNPSSDKNTYNFYVDVNKWDNEMLASQEVLGIIGYCRSATKDGVGEVYIYNYENDNILAKVVDGNFTHNR